MPQFDSSTYISQLFWLVLCFTSVTFAFVKVLLPRLQQAVIHRHTRLEALRKKADRLMYETAKLNATLDARLKEAHEDAYILLQRNRQKLLEEQHNLLKKHDQVLKKRMAMLHTKLDREYQLGLQALRDEAKTYVDLLNIQLLQAPTDTEKEEKPMGKRVPKKRRVES